MAFSRHEASKTGKVPVLRKATKITPLLIVRKTKKPTEWMNDEQSYSQASLICRNTSEGRGPQKQLGTQEGVASLWGKAMQGGARAERTHPMETKTKGGLVLQEGLGFCSQGGRGGGDNKNRVEGETRGG